MPAFQYTYGPISELFSDNDQGLLAGGIYLSNAINNSNITNLDIFLSIFGYSGAPTGVISVGLLYSFDNSNWSSVEGGIVLDTFTVGPALYPQGSPLRVFIGGIRVYPYYMKIYVRSHLPSSSSPVAVFSIKAFGWNYAIEQV